MKDNRRRMLMNGKPVMEYLLVVFSTDKGTITNVPVTINGINYTIPTEGTGITVQIPVGTTYTIIPGSKTDYIKPSTISCTAGETYSNPNDPITVNLTYKLETVWVNIYMVDVHHDITSSIRPCFAYNKDGYGEMGTLKDKGSVIWGIRGYTELSDGISVDSKNIVLSNNAYIRYYKSGMTTGYLSAFIYDTSKTKVTTVTDNYWTLTFSSATSIKTLTGIIKNMPSPSLSQILVTRSTYKSVTGLDYS